MLLSTTQEISILEAKVSGFSVPPTCLRPADPMPCPSPRVSSCRHAGVAKIALSLHNSLYFSLVRVPTTEKKKKLATKRRLDTYMEPNDVADILPNGWDGTIRSPSLHETQATTNTPARTVQTSPALSSEFVRPVISRNHASG